MLHGTCNNKKYKIKIWGLSRCKNLWLFPLFFYLCSIAFSVDSIVLCLLFLFYITQEFDWFLHRGWAKICYAEDVCILNIRSGIKQYFLSWSTSTLSGINNVPHYNTFSFLFYYMNLNKGETETKKITKEGRQGKIAVRC